MKHAFKKIMALLLAVVMVIGILPAAFAANVEPFTDVQDSDWFAPYVKYVYEHKPVLMNGTTKTTFEPNGTLTRAMAAVVLYRLADPVIPSVRPSTFTDLEDDWYKNGVAWAQQTGIVNGISESKFNPNGLVSREQLVAMMWRYNEKPEVEEDYLADFADAAKVSDYAKAAFNWAVSKTIIGGMKDKSGKLVLNPQGNATRAEFAKIISVFNEVTRECEGNHSWNEGEQVKAATCTEDGEIIYTCIRCGETKTEIIPALGHSYVDGVCGNCGEKLADKGDIVIYYTNDIHTYIDGALSYDNIADLKAQTSKVADGVLLVDAGDHIQGTAYGSMDKGQHIIELMNAAKYDLATLGNHEFDYGMARALEITKIADFDYVSANFYNEKNGVKGAPVLDPFQILTAGDKKIAMIGITTPETFTKSTPAYFQDEAGNYIYGIAGGDDGAALYADVQAAINAAKAVGADYIIALGHLGDDPASKPWTSEELIANVSGLDAFIDGHSHSTVEGKEVADKDGNKVLLTQTGEYFDAIGKMTINAEGITTELITSYAGSDATVAGIKNEWIAEIETKLGEVIGYAEVTLDNYVDGGRIVRKQETNTGDFAADALYYLFDVTEGLEVDLAIMNGGGVRNKAVTGELSYLSCKEIHTFGNVACLQTVTGQQILDALEWGAKSAGTAESGCFLQVSGVTYEIHTYIPSTVQKDEKGVWTGAPTGEYRVKNVKIGGEALDLNATYNMAGYNYTLRDLGDGFAMFEGAVNVKDYVMEDYMVLANYIKSFAKDESHNNLPTIKADSIYAEVTGEGRIVMVNEDPNGGNGGNQGGSDEFVLSNTLKEGDEVIIVCTAKNIAFSGEKNPDKSYYNAGVSVNPVDGKIVGAEAAIVWTVGKDGNNYTFSQDGMKIGMAAEFSSTDFGAVNDTWAIESAKTAGSYYLKNVGRNVYLEWYEANSYWSGYYNNSVEELFALSFYVKGGSNDDSGNGGNQGGTDNSGDYVLTGTVKDGDEVVIVCTAKNIAFSGEKNPDKSYYNAGVAVNPVDGKISNPDAAIVWTVGKDGNNYTFSQNGQKIGMAAEFSSTDFGAVNDTWAIEAAKTAGAYYLKNVGRNVYLEWYEANNYWSGYYNNSVEELFALNFYVKGGSGDIGGDDPIDPPAPPAGDQTFEKVTADQADWSGSYVIGWDDGSNAFIFNGETDKDLNHTSAAIADNKVTAPASAIVVIEKVSGGYTLKATGGYLNGKVASGAASNGLAFETAPSVATITWENGNPIITSAIGTIFRFNNATYSDGTTYSWFRFFKPTSSVQTPVSLYKLVEGEAPELPEVPEVPDTPVDPELPDLPDDPITGDVYGLTTELKDGDKVVFVNKSVSQALSSEAASNGYNRAALEVAPADGKLIDPAEAIVWAIEMTDGGFFMKNAEGKKLSIGNKADGTTYNSMGFDQEDNAVWAIAEAATEGCIYLQNTTAVGKTGDPKSVEWYAQYSNFSMYYIGSADEALFAMEMYVLGAEVEEVCNHSWGKGNVTVEPTCTEDGEMTYTCAFCGETKTEVLAAFGHDYVDGVCECGAKEPVAGAYTIATSLKVGDQIIITADFGGAHYAMTSDTSTISNAFYASPVTVSGGSLALGADTNVVWTVCAGSTEGTYTLRNAEGQYIFYSGSGTGVKLGDVGSDFAITCGNGTSKLNVSGTTRNLFYSFNSSKNQFRFYSESNLNATGYSSVLTIWTVG